MWQYVSSCTFFKFSIAKQVRQCDVLVFYILQFSILYIYFLLLRLHSISQWSCSIPWSLPELSDFEPGDHWLSCSTNEPPPICSLCSPLADSPSCSTLLVNHTLSLLTRSLVDNRGLFLPAYVIHYTTIHTGSNKTNKT